MNIYTDEVTCDVCVATGVARPRDATARWLGGTLRHNDPKICAWNLENAAARLAAQQAEFDEQFRLASLASSGL